MSSELLAKLAEEFFQASLDSSPTSAIMRGHKKYFDQIEELTDEKFEEEMENVQNFKNSLSNIDLNSLSDKEKVTYGMLEFASSAFSFSVRLDAQKTSRHSVPFPIQMERNRDFQKSMSSVMEARSGYAVESIPTHSGRFRIQRISAHSGILEVLLVYGELELVLKDILD